MYHFRSAILALGCVAWRQVAAWVIPEIMVSQWKYDTDSLSASSIMETRTLSLTTLAKI
jgi:hypothetical protein